MNEKIKLSLKPVKFSSLKFLGELGNDWTMIEYNLSKLITQNVLYSIYHEPKTIREISAILGIKTNLVADEIDFLENNGFIQRASDDKYLTNILLHDLSESTHEKKHKIFSKYAKIVCEKFIPQIYNRARASLKLLDSCCFDKDETIGTIYSPKGDFNFLLWSMISFLCNYKLKILPETESLSSHFVKRNDGGENIAVAEIENDYNLSYNKDIYKVRFESVLSLKSTIGNPFYIWVYNTFYDNRQFDWSKIFQKEYVELYENLTSKNGVKNIEMVVTSMTTDELLKIFPHLLDEYITLNKELSDEIYNICKSEYPQHKQELCRAFYQNSLSNSEMIVRIIELALLKGFLKPIKEEQKMNVNMIMFLN